jgi:inorganic pyrophosphatase/exopolyphosphatase
MFVLGNQAADLDSFVSALALSLLLGPEYTAVINCKRIDFPLRTEVKWLLDHLDYHPTLHFIDDEITANIMQSSSESIILVDFNFLPGFPDSRIIGIYGKITESNLQIIMSTKECTDLHPRA